MKKSKSGTNNKRNIVEAISNIQSLVRCSLEEKRRTKAKDKMTIDFIDAMIDFYNKKLIFNQKINCELSNRKIRNENFPSEISENIVKFCIWKKYHIMCCWDTLCGDLEVMNLRIEVKGFMSSGRLQKDI